MAVYATKHARRTNRTIEAHELDTSEFDNLRAQREIEDKARETKPTLPAGAQGSGLKLPGLLGQPTAEQKGGIHSLRSCWNG